MALEGRLKRLEARLKPDPDPWWRQEAFRREAAILDAYAAIRAASAENTSRGGVLIEPRDEAAILYGPDYTLRQVWGLAVNRGLTRCGASEAEIDALREAYIDAFVNPETRGEV